jgi:hypothetical protein
MFSDSENFEIRNDWGSHNVFHKRNIGPTSTWADRVINGVHIDKTCNWQNRMEYLLATKEISCNQEPKTIMVNDRGKVNKTILESESMSELVKGSGESKNWFGYGKSDESAKHRKWLDKNYSDTATKKETGKDKTFFRKRNIPRSKHKNYSVKPITDYQRDKHFTNQEKFDEIIHSKEFEEMYLVDEVNGEITEKYLDRLLNEGVMDYQSPVPEYPKETHAFVDVSSEDITEYYVALYDAVVDTYDYYVSNSPYGDPANYRIAMWCPPKDWIKPVIHWDWIWSEMDEELHGYRRSYTYTPLDVTRGASIKFHNANM